MNARVHSRLGLGLLVFGLAAVMGCGRTSPVSPTSAAASVSQPGVIGPASASPAMTIRATGFPIVSGTFTIASDSGDSVTGTYTGTSFVSASAPERALLTLQISGGTGTYAGASGSMGASGVGAFTGEGAFTADIKGDALVSGKHLPLRIALAGTSSVSCSANSEIVISQTATGSMKKTGDVHATLMHVVGQAGCSS